MKYLTLHETAHPTMDNKFILMKNDAYFIHVALLEDENCPTFTDMIEKI